MANDDMRALWNGEDTTAWVVTPDRYDTMLARYGDAVLAAADLANGASVLDVGCGAGALSCRAAQAVGPDGRVTGVDISRPLVDVATARAQTSRITNARFIVADAQTDDIEGAPFDAVISRFGVMFFADPIAAFAKLRAQTRTGGRLAFVCWQPLAANEWALAPVVAVMPILGVPDAPPPGAPGPFAFAEPDHVRDVLTRAGWDSITIEADEASMNVGGARTAEDALAFYREDPFGRVLFGRGDATQQAAAADALLDVLTAHTAEDGVRLGAATWVVTAC